MPVKIQTKRVYEAASKADGVRILIDRIWPRGVSKEKAKIDFWAKEVAPSTELRQWYRHEPSKWVEFQRRYYEELDENQQHYDALTAYLKGDVVTLVYSSKETKLNNATALQQYIEKRLYSPPADS